MKYSAVMAFAPFGGVSFLGGEIDNYQFHCLFGSPVCANEVEYSGAIISLLKDAEFEDFCVF